MSGIVVAGDNEGLPHAVLHPDGDADAYRAGALRESWDDLEDVKLLVVVLNDVPFMDSAELGAVISGVSRFRAKGGMVVVLCDKAPVARLLDTTGLSAVMGPVAESYQKALEMLRESLG